MTPLRKQRQVALCEFGANHGYMYSEILSQKIIIVVIIITILV
jgi:SAM-dependent MidA family methyltransferase